MTLLFANIAFADDVLAGSNTLAPKSAIKLLDEYRHELEVLSRDSTSASYEKTSDLQKEWDRIYKGSSKSFDEFVRALAVEEGWVAAISRHLAKKFIEVIGRDKNIKNTVTVQSAEDEFIGQITEWARENNVPKYRKTKLINAIRREFGRLAEDREPAPITADNELVTLAGQRQIILKPFEVTSYLETAALPRIVEVLYAVYEDKGYVRHTDFEKAAADERARFLKYLDYNKPYIVSIYKHRAAIKTDNAVRFFDDGIRRYAELIDITPLKDEATFANYFNFSDESRIFRIYPKQKARVPSPIIREHRARMEVQYSDSISYRRFKAAGMLDRDGNVRVWNALPNPRSTVRHEIVGHVTTAYLIATNAPLFRKIIDSFQSLADPQKEDILRQFISVRVNPFYKNMIPKQTLDAFPLDKLTELLRNTREWRVDKAHRGKSIGSDVNWTRVVDEVIALWAEFDDSYDNIESVELKAAAKRLHSSVNDWIEKNKALFRRAGYFESPEDILRKEIAGISSIAWCWSRQLSDYVNKKNEKAGTGYDADEAYNDVRESDENFSRSLIDAIGQNGMGDIDVSDKDSLAGQLSDDIVEDVFLNEVVPKINRTGGKIDIDKATERIAEQLKERIFQDIDTVSIGDILGILKRPDLQTKLRTLIEKIEKYAVLDKDDKPADDFKGSPVSLPGKVKPDAARGSLKNAVKQRQETNQRRAPRGGSFSPASADTASGKWDGGEELPLYLKDLTREAREGKVDEVFFRDEEIREIKKVINRKESPNIMLLGDRGVGKTAIVDKIALEIASGDAGYGLDTYRILSLDAAAFIAASGGTADGFGALVKGLVDLVSDGKTILFVDEIHVFSDRRGIPGVTSNFFQFLKEPLARGRIRVIGATTFDEFKADIESDKAFVGRFTTIDVKPPVPAQAKNILIALRERYEKAQNKNISDERKRIAISEDACIAAVDISERVLKTEPLLRKAAKALDEASAAVRTRQDDIEARIREAKKNIVFYSTLLRKARAEGKRGRSDELSLNVKKEARAFLNVLRRKEEGFSYMVNTQDVLEAFKKFGIPANVINETEKEKVGGLEDYLNSNLKGQPEAISAVVGAVKRSYVNQNRKKPIGTFFLAGPTGSGKTELAKLLARYLFDSDDPEKDGTLIRVDLSQYAEAHRISQLIGAPPGYVGYSLADTFLERVKKKPYSVILLDEADKCHPDILTKVFLPVTEEGSIRTPSGDVVDFSNTIIIFTSNFGMTSKDYTMPLGTLNEAIKKAADTLPPEFWGRMQKPIVYNFISKDVARGIIKDIQLPDLVKRYERENNVAITFEDPPGRKWERWASVYKGLFSTLALAGNIPLIAAMPDGGFVQFDNIIKSAKVFSDDKEAEIGRIKDDTKSDVIYYQIVSHAGINYQTVLMSDSTIRIYKDDGALLCVKPDAGAVSLYTHGSAITEGHIHVLVKERGQDYAVHSYAITGDSNRLGLDLYERIPVPQGMHPKAFAVDKNEDIYILHDGKVIVLDESGGEKRSITVTLNTPDSLAVDESGYIYISGTGSDKIEVIRLNAGAVSRFFLQSDVGHVRALSTDRKGSVAVLGEKEAQLFARSLIEDTITDLILEKGYDPMEGARGIKKAIERLIDDELADMLLDGRLHEKNSVVIRRGLTPDDRLSDTLDFIITNGAPSSETTRLVSSDPAVAKILTKIDEILEMRNINTNDLDAIADLRPDNIKTTRTFKSREKLVFKKSSPFISAKLTEHLPNKQDENLDKLFSDEAIGTFITDNGYQADSKLVEVIGTSIRRLVNEAKRQNRDMLTRLIAKKAGYQQLSDAADADQALRKQVLETARTSRAVAVNFVIEDGALKAEVNYPTVLTLREEERLIKLFGHEIKEKAEVDKTPRSDRPLAESRYDILRTGGISGYEKEEGQATSIWFTVKLNPSEITKAAGRQSIASAFASQETITIAPFPEGVFKDENLIAPRAFHQTGDTLYVAGGNSNTVIALDIKTGGLVTEPFEVTRPAGRQSIASAFASQETITIAPFPEGVFKDEENLIAPRAFHQTGDTLYVAGVNSNTIIALDIKTGGLVTEPFEVTRPIGNAENPEISGLQARNAVFTGGKAVNWNEWKEVKDGIIISTRVAGLSARRNAGGTYDIDGGGLVPKTEDIDLAVRDIREWMERVKTHALLAPYRAEEAPLAIVINKRLCEMAVRDDAAGASLGKRYQVMKQNLRREFLRDTDSLSEAETRDELISRVNTLTASGRKVIILDDSTLTYGLAEGVIHGRAGEDYCVVNADIAVPYDTALFPFVNMNAMAMMGAGMLYKDTILFSMAYKIFTGKDAPEIMILELANKTLWIVKALPRIVKITDELKQDDEFRALFLVSA